MENAEHLYTRVLVWAYQQGSQGFTWQELGKELQLTGKQQTWVENVLYLSALTTESLFNRVTDIKDKEQRFCLSGRGIKEAVQYLQLVETEKTGKRAQWIAVASILIGAAVGIAQVVAIFWSK